MTQLHRLTCSGWSDVRRAGTLNALQVPPPARGMFYSTKHSAWPEPTLTCSKAVQLDAPSESNVIQWAKHQLFHSCYLCVHLTSATRTLWADHIACSSHFVHQSPFHPTKDISCLSNTGGFDMECEGGVPSDLDAGATLYCYPTTAITQADIDSGFVASDVT